MTSQIRTTKVLVFGLCLLPFVFVVAATFNLAGLSLGANPVEEIIHTLGLWGLRLLLLTLAISLPVLLIKPFPQIQFVVWLAANYLLHLALEVFVSLRDLGQNHGPSQGGPPPAADLSDSPTRDASSPGAAQE